MPTNPALRRRVRRGRTVLVLAAAGALLLAGTALAGSAVALEDPRRPVAEVTHGPSCGPGAVRVQVTNGSRPHSVALVFNGTVVQGTAALAPAEQVELGSADVPWGATVHVGVTVTDAAGVAQQPLDFGTYTRPTKADCDALDVPAVPVPAVAAPGITAADVPVAPVPGSAKDPAPLPPMGAGGTSPVPGGPLPEPQAVPAADRAPATDAAAAPPVAPGGVVTVRGSGFSPGEPVDVTLDGGTEPLTSVLAAADGTVEAVVQIPRGAALGSVTVQLVGRTSSATSGLDLQVAARDQLLAESAGPVTVPTMAAGAALLVASAGLGAAAARRPRTADLHVAPRH